jgi:hypothetical protein
METHTHARAQSLLYFEKKQRREIVLSVCVWGVVWYTCCVVKILTGVRSVPCGPEGVGAGEVCEVSELHEPDDLCKGQPGRRAHHR